MNNLKGIITVKLFYIIDGNSQTWGQFNSGIDGKEIELELINLELELKFHTK